MLIFLRIFVLSWSPYETDRRTVEQDLITTEYNIQYSFITVADRTATQDTTVGSTATTDYR